MQNQVTRMVKFTALALVSGGLCLASSAFAGSKLAPANSMAFGKSLAQWEDIYMRWFVGNVTIPADANGNAVVNGVVLMPIPNAAGDGTPAQQAVTLNHGQAFFMPLLYELGTSYTDGTPSDPFLDRSYFTSFSVSLQIDGVPVINNSNAMDYFTQFSFAPPVPLEFANIDSLIWYQGFNVAHAPLSVGKHTIQLDEKAGQALPPNFGSLLLEYHNTWTVTVLP